MKLAVLLPSRGLVFSQTIEELLLELKGLDFEIFFSHQRPIPECFNEPMEKILAREFTHVWIVEEDMILPEGILNELLRLNAPIATSDYPAVEGIMCVSRNEDGDVLYTGTGCLLIAIEVLKEMERPIFDTSKAYTPDGTLIGERNQEDKSKLYGQHDIHFFLQAREKGIKIGVTQTNCGQRKITSYGQPNVNNGFHEIRNLV